MSRVFLFLFVKYKLPFYICTVFFMVFRFKVNKDWLS